MLHLPTAQAGPARPSPSSTPIFSVWPGSGAVSPPASPAGGSWGRRPNSGEGSRCEARRGPRRGAARARAARRSRAHRAARWAHRSGDHRYKPAPAPQPHPSRRPPTRVQLPAPRSMSASQPLLEEDAAPRHKRCTVQQTLLALLVRAAVGSYAHAACSAPPPSCPRGPRRARGAVMAPGARSARGQGHCKTPFGPLEPPAAGPQPRFGTHLHAPSLTYTPPTLARTRTPPGAPAGMGVSPGTASLPCDLRTLAALFFNSKRLT